MATLPSLKYGLDEDSDETLVLPHDHRLAGWTVDALLDQGKAAEARDELERLVMEGVNSGPGIEVTPAFWAGMKAEIKKRAQTQRER